MYPTKTGNNCRQNTHIKLYATKLRTGSEHAEKYKVTWLKWKPEGYTGNRKRESSFKKFCYNR